ncbi:Crystal protein ET79 [Streptomyces sp. ISL-44]|uniref:Crystal protein ET79 n=1 Tax=Streptomyces sp. ISL-44 TaxID=2819184 RepID=UPI001BE52813|nr:Crystal protein ET79 [Streptomyces sp. ISL-44]MBT2546376.1 Crystal protein ET79 [Streptomyces sp. ISL-44]
MSTNSGFHRGARSTAVAVMAAAMALAPAVTAVAATGNDTSQQSSVGVQSARSTKVTVVNETSTTMYRNFMQVAHGIWDDETPPEQIDGFKEATFGSHSQGVMTGTEGQVNYALGHDGEAAIRWSNPYVGGNGYNCSVPKEYTCSRSGGGGNNAEVKFIIGRNGSFSVNAVRSTLVKLQNRTPNSMERKSSSLAAGMWTDNMVPPDQVYPFSDGSWQSESNGVMTGTEGAAVYSMLNVGTVSIGWSNPYVGSNGYYCHVPQNFVCKQSGGGGDNANVTFTVMKG